MELFEDNLAVLEARSPRAARCVRAVAQTAEFAVARAADGSAIVERGGSPLDSRRAPADAARRQVQAVPDGAIVVAGIGAGYLSEALLDAGRPVAAILEARPEALAAAMQARDLRGLLSRVPVLLADAVRDPVELICLKAKAPVLVPQASCVAGEPILQAIVTAWPQVPAPSRAPRVLVVGPIAGGSLETARSTANAVGSLGAECKFLDFAPFAGAQDAIAGFGMNLQRTQYLQSRYAEALGEVVVEQAVEWRPDLVLALAQAPLWANHLEGLRQAGARTAFWFVENGRVLQYWKTMAAAYDVFFAIQPGEFLESLREAGAPKPVYVPTACDASRHVPVALTAEEEARFGAPVSFAGAPYLNRRRTLPVLSDLGLRVWGEGWERSELSQHAAEGGRRFDLADMIRIFAASKVNLNIHSAQHVDGLDPDPDYVNPRTFELAACGAFQLVDDRQPLRELFDDDEVVAFRSVAEMRDQVRYYLDHPEERAAIARRARVRALSEHTFENRVRKILSESLPAVMVAAALLGGCPETLDEAIDRLSGDATMSPEEALLRALREARLK